MEEVNAPTTEQLEAQRIAELDEVSKQREAVEAEAAAKQAEIERLETENSAIAFSKSVSEARVNTGLKFHLNTKDLIKLLAKEPDVEIDQRTGTVFASGKRVSLEDALIGFARRHPWSTEYTPVNADRKKGYDGVESRDQLIGTHAKVSFIKKFGQETYENLPQHSVPRGDITKLPPSELRKLPTQEKTKIIRRIGEAGWARLLDSSREPNRENTWGAISKATRGVNE